MPNSILDSFRKFGVRQLVGVLRTVSGAVSFAELANVSAGSTIVCRFPVRKFTTQEEVLGTQYTADWVGDTVVGISPAGSRVPLYRRNKEAVEAVSNVAKIVPDIAFRF